MSIVHVTPGLLDIRAITIFGLHAKPGTDTPIGKFGTGLKYAVATLLRLGCSVRLFVGTTEYEFYTKADKFRGVEYSRVYMKQRYGVLSKWRSIELPFTVDHGKFWQAWQAFRELHSNTLDEDGVTFNSLDGAHETFGDIDEVGEQNKTKFIVSGSAYEQAFLDKDKTFLPKAKTKREGDDRVQVFNEPSNHLYWRGIRIYDLEKPSIYTYNILADIDLTEDRTLKYQHQAHQYISGYVARSNDPKLISAVVSAEADKFFESKLDFDWAYESPSAEFQEVLKKKRLRGRYVAPYALAFHDRYAPKVVPKEETLREKMSRFVYDMNLPLEVRDTFKFLLGCQITEPGPDDDIPF